MTGSSPVGPDGLGEGGREFETLTMGDKRKQKQMILVETQRFGLLTL